MIPHALKSCSYPSRVAGNFMLSAIILIALMFWAFLFIFTGTVQAQEAGPPDMDSPPAGDTIGMPPEGEPGTASPPEDTPMNGDEAAEALAPEAPPPEVMADFEVTTEDLGAVEAAILPDSPWHIFKRMGRGIQEAITFDPVKDAELKLQHANQQLAEVKQLIDEDGIKVVNPATIARAIDVFEAKFEDIKETAGTLLTAKATAREEVETLLDEVTDKQLKQQQMLDNIAEEVMEVKKEAEMLGEEVGLEVEEILASVQDTKNKSMADFTDMLVAVDVEPEKVSARITGVMDKQGGSEFKSLKNLEVLEAVYEKVPETAKEAIAKAKQNTIQKFEIRVKNIPEAVRAERFENYVEHAVADETRLISLLDEIKQSTGLPDDILAKIEQAKEITVRKFEKKLRLIDDVKVKEGLFMNFDPANVSDMIAMEEFKNRMSADSEELRIMEALHNKSLTEFKKKFTDITSQEQAERFQKLSEEMMKNPSPKTFKLMKELEMEVRNDPTKRAFVEQMEQAITQQLETRFRREGDKFMDRITTLDPRDIAVFEELKFKKEFKDKFVEKNADRFKDFMRDVEEPEHFDRFHERFFDVPEFVVNEIKRNDENFQDAMLFKTRKMEERRMEKEREITMAKLDYEEREIHFQMDRLQRQKEDEFWNKMNSIPWEDFDTRKGLWEEKLSGDYEVVEQRFDERKRIFEERMKNDPWCDDVCQQIQMQFMDQEFRHEQERLADDLVRERNRIEAEKMQHFEDNPLADKCRTPEECDQYCHDNPKIQGCEWAMHDPMPRRCPPPGWWDEGQRECMFPEGPPPPMWKDCPPGEFWNGFKQRCEFDPYWKPPDDFIDCPPFHRWNERMGTCEPEFFCEMMYMPPPCAPGEMPKPPRPDDPCGQPSCIMGMPVICPPSMPAPCPPGQFRETHKDHQGCPVFGECISSGPQKECPPEYMPVCGTDNITYDNECWAKMAGVGIMSFGSCEMVFHECPFNEYWEPRVNRCLKESDYVPHLHGQCDYGWTWRDGYCSRETTVVGECRTYCEPPCMSNSYCMYDEFGCAERCSPECGPAEHFDPMMNMCLPMDQPEPKPEDNNWVSHTWQFSDGQTEISYILNRTDQQYLDYIAKVHAQCLTIPKWQFRWRQNISSGDPQNWEQFGIPYCEGTGAPSDCFKEGGILPYNMENATCCEGLRPVDPDFTVERNIGQEVSCIMVPLSYIPSYICTKCGDGICKDIENWCNCPDDCEKPAKILCNENIDCGVDSCQQGRDKCLEIKYVCENGECSGGQTEFPGFICQKGGCRDTCGNGICDSMEKLHCPQDCKEEKICKDSLDCPIQMKCENSVCVDLGCIQEGEMGPSAGINPEWLDHLPTECCEGLKSITYSGLYDENCDLELMPGAPSEVCTKCGDGQCGEGETKCNCPSDCGTAVVCPSNMYNDYTSSYNCSYTQCPNGCSYDNQGCPAGCTTTAGYCGDGVCDSDETASSCPDDCVADCIYGETIPTGGCNCGGFYHESGSCCYNWGGTNWISSGTCYGSDSQTCSEGENTSSSGCWCGGISGGDHYVLPNTHTPIQYCCNGVKQTTSCSASYCGNGTCDSDETSSSCPDDCAPAEYVNLHSVNIKGSYLNVSYSKNFATCAHLLDSSSSILHSKNVFCDQSDNIQSSSNLSEFSIESGQQVKLCHGNNYNICSDYVTVTGSAKSIIVTSPSAGAQWTKGSPYNISWQYEGWEPSQYVHVDVQTGSGGFTLFSQHDKILISSGSVAWTIGNKWPDLPTGDNFYIRVFVVPIAWTEGVDYDKSDSFSILKAITYECTDTDGGKNYYSKGNAQSSNQDVEGRVDCCKLNSTTYLGDPVAHIGPGGGPCTDGPYLYEAFCEPGNHVPQLEVYECPNGCQNGVCL